MAKTNSSLRESLKTLGSLLKSMNKLVPGVSVVSGLVLITVGYFVIQAGIMMGFTAFVVFVVAVAVYVRTNNYGEAALSLVAGLLTVFTVDWTASTFTVFLAIWGGFTVLIFLVMSVRLASKQEDIYSQAMLSLAPLEELKLAGSPLQAIAEKADCSMDPIERAECIRLFAYRKLPVDSMGRALEAVDKLSTISRVGSTRVASFVSDVYRVFEPSDEADASLLLDQVYSLIRDSPAAPQEYFEAFDQSRRLVLSERLDSERFFQLLNSGLAAGVPPSDMHAYMAEALGQA